MESGELISIKTILSDVLMMVGDPDLKKGFSLGWYRSQVQSAVEKLALHTFFQVLTKDSPMPKVTLQDPLPKNCFNIREMYAWSGDCCTPDNSAIIHFKRLYNNKPGGTSYTALRKDTSGQAIDPFQPVTTLPISAPVSGSAPAGVPNLLYANVQNGLIMFSSSCSGYDQYRIVYNGMGGDIGDEPIIPRVLREPILDMTIERIYRAYTARDPKFYRALWSDSYERLYNRRNGTYWDALKIVSAMDGWKKDDYAEYGSRGDW